MNINRILNGMILILVFGSCTTTLPIYTPNAPFLEKKGDARISAGAVLGGVSTGGNIQVAYAPVNHLYIGAGTSLLKHEFSNSTFTDLTMGYFGRKSNLAYEFSLGGGLGSFRYETSEKDKLSRIHLQAAAAYVSKIFQAGGGIRLASNSYDFVGYKPDTDPGGGNVIYEGDYSGITTVEPFFLMRIGGPKISFQLAGAFPVLTTENIILDPDPTLTLGVSFKLGKKK